VQQGQEEVVRVLCAAGADRGKQKLNGGATPMQIALELKMTEIVNVLCEPPLRQEPRRIGELSGPTDVQLKQKHDELEEARAKIRRLEQELEEATHSRGLHASRGRSPTRVLSRERILNGDSPLAGPALLQSGFRSQEPTPLTVDSPTKRPQFRSFVGQDGQEVVEKIIEVPIPQVQVVEKVVEVPQVLNMEKIEEVTVVQFKEKVEYVPHIVYQEVIKQIPKVTVQEVVKQVPRIVIQEVLKELPKDQYNEYMASMAGLPGDASMSTSAAASSKTGVSTMSAPLSSRPLLGPPSASVVETTTQPMPPYSIPPRRP
jgi:hypothetical protein